MLSLDKATWKAGWSKKELTPFRTPLVMMGWGDEHNIARSQFTPLNARAIHLTQAQTEFYYLYLEICYITHYLHRLICEKAIDQGLIKDSSQIQMSASHTHSGPGGINEHLYYEVPTPGLQKDVIERIVEVSLEVLKASKENSEKARIYYAERDFPEETPVAFNRSMSSYLRNQEIDNPKTANPKNAIDRTMSQWNIIRENDHAIINWFGVHGTCLSKNRNEYHFDNKGYACQYMEEYLGEGSMAIFAQASAGDVTPHNVFDATMSESRGDLILEDKYAQKNGKLQQELAVEIFKDRSIELNGPMYFTKHKADFSKLEVGGLYTVGASFGVAMIQGTKEGPGIPTALAIVLKAVVRFSKMIRMIFSSSEQKKQLERYYAAQGNKDVFINADAKELLGFKIRKKVRLISLVDPVIKKMNQLLATAEYGEKSTWLDQQSYYSLMVWGSHAIVALPFEVSSMASRRLKSVVKKLHPEVKSVTINGYCYSYMGYLLTPEEYENQLYEGGHSVFGKWLLPNIAHLLEKQSEVLYRDRL
ncbi:MAG: hypothetical protein CME65_00575 [Halobacteriovoraceae bacterium]|nr:hypothetical protein [Halobacteriovoraceae bacterium]|tara:strand:+ start:967 stop:2565 length:1599 start_codon:yes stop_codon:yes gene_type:complete